MLRIPVQIRGAQPCARPFLRIVLALVIALTFALPSVSVAQALHREGGEESLTEISKRTAEVAMAQARSIRWAQASEQTFVAPLPSLHDDTGFRLILNSRFAEPVLVSVQVSAASGVSLVVANEELQPRRTLEIDLLQATQLAGGGFTPTSATVSFFGDKEMIQAWVLLVDGQDHLEVPLQHRASETAWSWTSFWDARLVEESRDARPEVTFVNSGSTTANLTLQWKVATGRANSEEVTLAPFATYRWEPSREASPSHGFLRAQHDGSPGQVLAGGYLRGERLLVGLPVLGSAAILESKVYDSPILPLAHSGENRPVLSLFQPGREFREPARVEVEIFDSHSGDRRGWVERWLLPEEIQSLDLQLLFPELFSSPKRPMWLHIASEGGPLLAYGVSFSPSGIPADIPLVSRQKVHESGTYPVPNLEANRVATTLLNVGGTAAEVFAHLMWDDKEYTLEPIRIPAGTAHVIDFQEMVGRAEPDLQGRKFEPGASPVYLQWLSRRGSSELLARTEIQPLDSEDSYGFNCFGCCEEWPSGGIEPGFAVFGIGGSADFVPVEFVETCTGSTMGPYTAYPKSTSYVSPLGWNYSQVWANSGTNQTVSFSSDGLYMWVSCDERSRNFAGDAPVVVEDACLLAHHPNFNPEQGCCGMHGSNTNACNTCCGKQKMVATCRCNKIPFYRVLSRRVCHAGVGVSSKKCNDQCKVCGI